MQRSLALALASSLGSALAAQCSGVWQSTGYDGVGGSVAATTMWDPDGAGPAVPVAVIGGKFVAAGPLVANNIATWDPQTGSWTALGNGLTHPTLVPEVRALAVLPNGDLVAAGFFTTAGGTLVNHIARWNGTAWSGFAGGASSRVEALTVAPNGDLIAAGGLSSIGGVVANGIARWNGTTWAPLGAGVPQVITLTVWNGDVVAGGSFSTPGGGPANCIARCNGASWSPLGTGVGNSVFALAVASSGDLIAGGAFTTAGGSPAFRIARWDGTNWSPMGTGLNGYCYGLAVESSGALAVCGAFLTAGGTPSANVAEWDGTAWSPLGSGLPAKCTTVLPLPNGDLLVAGGFPALAGSSADGLARWNGTAWSPLGGSSGSWNAPITASVTLPNGNLIVGGAFTLAEGVPCSYVARKHGSLWSAVGVPPGPVTSLAANANGDLFAAFTGGGTPWRGVVQWNGTAWVSVGALAPSGDVTSLLAKPNGEVFAAWKYWVPVGTGGWQGASSRWDGSTWSNWGFFFMSGIVAMVADSAGDVHALVRAFDSWGSSSSLQRWSNGVWTPRAFVDGFSMATLQNGDLVIGQAAGVARWNGNALLAMPGGPNGYVLGLTVLPDGDLVAAGSFTSPAANIVRWDGTSWSALGTGVTGDVLTVASDAEGDILASGPIAAAGGAAAHHVARYETTCPVAAITYLAGCPTTVGNAQWNVEVGPWIGATYRVSCSNLPPLSFTVDTIGVLTNPVSLAALLPGAGVPGCSLVPDPLTLDMRTVINGVATSSLGIPVLPWLIGIAFYHQMIPFEFDAANNLIGVTGTDTLQLTIGSL